MKWFHFSKMSSAIFIRFFGKKKSGNFERWKRLETMIKKERFFEKKLEGVKYAGDFRPSCYVGSTTFFHLID